MGIIARQATLNTLLAYLGIGLGFVNVVLLYPKVLDADQFGLTRLLVSLATIAAQVAQLGAENTVIRYFPYFRDPAKDHRGLLGMLLLFGTTIGLITMLVLGMMQGVFADIFSDRNALFVTHGWLLLPIVFSEIHFILLRSYSRSLQRTVQPSFIREFVLRLLQTGLICFQAWRPMPFADFMLVYTGIFLLSTLLLVFDIYRAGHFKLGWAHRWLPRRLRKSMLTYSSYTLSASLAGIILGNMDQLMIGALLGDGLKYVAHYAVAFYFGSVIAAPARALQQAAVPILADAWKQNDTAKIQMLYRSSSLVQFLISGFLFLLMVTSLDGLFALLPEEYAGGAQVALVIGLSYMLTSAVQLGVGIISMSKSFRLDAISSIGMLIVNLVANFFFIRSMGIVGAAYATFLSLMLVNVFRTWILYSRYGLWPFDRRTLFVALLIIGVLGVMQYVPTLDNPYLSVIMRTAVAAAMFLPAAYALGLMKELMEFSQQIRGKVVG
ncbi:MAG: polysaccharide biosynthesis C-terminal domain-containing protein [Flavobacteriales bacterium]|nr:polysaccharide biosynthesis C-terminal domain-containing protein [Flavobacteriales bacterium]